MVKKDQKMVVDIGKNIPVVKCDDDIFGLASSIQETLVCPIAINPVRFLLINYSNAFCILCTFNFKL